MKAVLFDLDGTLLPMDIKQFERAYFKGLCQVVPQVPPEKLIECVWAGTHAMASNDGSMTNREAFAKTFSQLSGMDFFSNEEMFLEYYRTGFQDCAAVCPITDHSRAIVDTLKGKGYRVAVATNPIFPEIATRSRLNWLGLEPEEFELVSHYENFSYAKPNPDYYREICRRMEVAPQDCLMVGNDIHEDMIAGTLGMDLFLVTDHLVAPEGADLSPYPHGSLQDVLAWAKGL